MRLLKNKSLLRVEEIKKKKKILKETKKMKFCKNDFKKRYTK